MLQRTWSVLALLALAGLAGSCSRGEAAAKQAGPPKGMAVPILAGEARMVDVPIDVPAIGNAEAMLTVTVRPQVTGPLATVGFAEGQMVKKDHVLFTIDPRPFEAALRHAEAVLARDQALARFNELDAEKIHELLKGGAAKPREHDEAQAKLAAAQAAVQADLAAVDTAKLQLGYCTIKSPLDGRTGPYLVDVGSLVKANDADLVQIKQLAPIYVSFSVGEQYLPAIQARLRQGKLRVEATVHGEGGEDQAAAGRPEVGELSFIDSQVDRHTSMITLKATFANEAHRLWPGQYLDVRLLLGSQRALVAPTTAIQNGLSGAFAYVIKAEPGDEGKEVLKVEQRAVTTGRSVDGLVVVTSGLQEGERVVTDGHLKLVPGAVVALKPPATQPATQPTASAAR